MSVSVHRPNWPIIVVLLIALWLRIALPVSSVAVIGDASQLYSPDTYTYVQPAAEWLATGKFAVNGNPEIIRTPGYAALLIPGILLNNLELITVALQILLSCATAYGIYRIGLLIFRRPAPALLGAALYALEPLSILYSSKLLTETLNTALVVFAAYCLIQYLTNTRWHYLLLAALGFSAAAYVRPANYYLPVVIVGVLAVWAIIHRPVPKRTVMQIGTFVLACGIMIGAWQVRNKAISGYSGFSAINAINVYFYHAAAVLAEQQDKSFATVQNELGYMDDALYLQAHPQQLEWSAAEKYDYQMAEGTRLIAAAPLAYLRFYVQGVLRTMLEPSAIEYLKMYNLYPTQGGLLGATIENGLFSTLSSLYRDKPLVFWSTLALALPLLGYYVLALIGLISDRMYRRAPVVMLIAIAGYFLVVAGGPVSVARYRHPLMPVVCLLAGHGLWQVIVRLRRMRLLSRGQA